MKTKYSLKTGEDWAIFKKENLSKNNIIIFKLSPVCGVSHTAEFEISKWLKTVSDNENFVIAEIDVIFSKELSRSIADEFSIVHQSPQLIWINKEGAVEFNIDHYDITSSTLKEKSLNLLTN